MDDDRLARLALLVSMLPTDRRGSRRICINSRSGLPGIIGGGRAPSKLLRALRAGG
jgi:hypothetical protein